MAFKEGQFHVVKQTNHFESFKYQFECLTCDWNDSFCKVKIHVRLLDALSEFPTQSKKFINYLVSVLADGRCPLVSQVIRNGPSGQLRLQRLHLSIHVRVHFSHRFIKVGKILVHFGPKGFRTSHHVIAHLVKIIPSRGEKGILEKGIANIDGHHVLIAA